MTTGSSVLSRVLAAAVTSSLHDAVMAFVAATDHHGALAPRALREVVERNGDYLIPETLQAAIQAANWMAELWAGGDAAWPNGPQGITESDRDVPVVLKAIESAGGPKREAWDEANWTVYGYGAGRSRVVLAAPKLPHPNERRQPRHNVYAVVAYLVEDDGSPRDTWDYRAEPIRALESAVERPRGQ